MNVNFFAATRSTPTAAGLSPLGSGHMATLTPDGVYRTYRLRWNTVSGAIETVNTVSRPASDWSRPRRFGGCAEDGVTARLLRELREVGVAGGAPAPPPVPGILAQVETCVFDLGDEFTQDYILRELPNNGFLAPAGAVVEEVIFDRHALFVSFDDGNCLELPPEAVLRPAIRPGIYLEAGTTVADVVPLDTDDWGDFSRRLSAEVVAAAARRVIEASITTDGTATIMDLRLVPKGLRMATAHGGIVSRVYECPQPGRKPVLVKPDVYKTHNLGELDFVHSRFRQ